MESPPTNQLSQPSTNTPVIHVIVRKPLILLAAVIEWLRENTTNYLMGQHSPDDDEHEEHVHIMLVHMKVSVEALRKMLKKNDINSSKEYAILLKVPKGRYKGKAYDQDKLGVYICKGDPNQPRSASYSQEIIDDWLEQWRDTSAYTGTGEVPVPDPEGTGDKGDKGTAKKLDGTKEFRKKITSDFFKDFDTTAHPSLDRVRRWTYMWFWKRDNWSPHPGVYRQAASSLYMMLAQRSEERGVGSITCAVDEIVEKYY
jgi:hypothetical protein